MIGWTVLRNRAEDVVPESYICYIIEPTKNFWLPEAPVKLRHMEPLRTFQDDLDEDEEKAWRSTVAALLPPLCDIINIPDLEDFAADTQAAIHGACEHHMEHKQPLKSNRKAWWTKECTAVVHALEEAVTCQPSQAKNTALWKALTSATRKAKREWADKVVTSGNVWEVAKWCHGRRLTKIATLWDPTTDDLTFEPETMSWLLVERFFIQDTRHVQTTQWDDPLPQEKRNFEAFTAKELL